MVLDSKIQQLKDHFGVTRLSDWNDVEPQWILNQPGIGQVTLDHVRIYLAGQNVTLRNDHTPEYWKKHLGHVRIGHQMSESDVGVMCPFKVFIDSGEQQPFSFAGIKSDASQQNRPLLIETEWRSLGRHPDSLGDYSLDGFVGHCHVERKSVEDLQGTILGFKDDRRERFECELGNLSRISAGAVVVEGTFLDCIKPRGDHWKKPLPVVQKMIMRSIIALQQDYKTPWLFCDNRRLAEIVTFRFLERYHRKHSAEAKEAARILAEL